MEDTSLGSDTVLEYQKMDFFNKLYIESAEEEDIKAAISNLKVDKNATVSLLGRSS